MSFDHLAPHYTWMERWVAGKKLQRCRVDHLHRVPCPKEILLAGEGHGRMLLECRRRFPQAHITCLDLSEHMLKVAEKRLNRENMNFGVLYVHDDARTWIAPRSYDLIVTHFFLDCFTDSEVALVVSRLSGICPVEGHWLLADFQIAPTGLCRLRCRLVLWALYRVFRRVTSISASTLVDPAPSLEQSGFRRVARSQYNLGLLYSECWRRTQDSQDPKGAKSQTVSPKDPK